MIKDSSEVRRNGKARKLLHDIVKWHCWLWMASSVCIAMHPSQIWFHILTCDNMAVSLGLCHSGPSHPGSITRAIIARRKKSVQPNSAQGMTCKAYQYLGDQGACSSRKILKCPLCKMVSGDFSSDKNSWCHEAQVGWVLHWPPADSDLTLRYQPFQSWACTGHGSYGLDNL